MTEPSELEDSFTPIKSQYVSVHPLEEKELYVLKHSKTRKYVLTNKIGIQVWKLLDGKKTITEIEEKISHVDPNEIKEFIAELIEMGFLEGFHEKRSIYKYSSRFIIKYPILTFPKTNRFLNKLYKYIGWTLNKQFTILSLFIAIFGFIIFYSDAPWLFFKRETFIISGYASLSIFVLPLFSVPILIIHEIYHSLACVKYGGEIPEIGVIIYYFNPGLYTDTTDAWLMERKKRIHIASGGIFSTLLLWTMFVFFYKYLQIINFASDGLTRLVTLYIYICSLIIVWSFNPFLENDGYYMLMDAVNIPNLRHEAFSYVKKVLRRIKQRYKGDQIYIPRTRKLIFILYIIGSLILTLLAIYTTLIWLKWIFLEVLESVIALLLQKYFDIYVMFPIIMLLFFLTVRILSLSKLILKSARDATQKA